MRKFSFSKTIYSLFFTFFLSLSLHAQSDSLKMIETKNALIASACSCISNIDTFLLKTSEDAGISAAKCLYADSADFFNYLKLNGFTDSTKDVKERGKKIGIGLMLEMYSKCPAIMSLTQLILLKQH